MTPQEALKQMLEYPDGSYMRCPFCGCKSKGTHGSYSKECPILVLQGAALDAERYRYLRGPDCVLPVSADEKFDKAVDDAMRSVIENIQEKS